MFTRWLCLLLVVSISTVFADEQVRQVQEELRKRNLYFGDIDGQARPELNNALRRYQTRKGFAVTGTISAETATSLNAQPREASASEAPALPDVPVLRSDRARELPPERRVALEKLAEQNPDLLPTPVPPAEAPSPSQEVDTESIKSLVQQYLHDGETDDIDAQTKYFDYPIEYFDHGTVAANFVHKDVTNYVKRWPTRKYSLLEPMKVTANNAGETLVQFPITFQVRNKSHTAAGRTMNYWTLRNENGVSKIVAIREQRLRE